MTTPDRYTMAVRAFARAVSLRLMLWSVLSMAGGLLLWRRGTPFWRGFGIQALAWGAIDALIAAAGLAGQRRSRDPSPAFDAPREARKLRRLLWFNAALDVGYMAGGAWLARTKGSTNPEWRGHGWGIVVQGAFLFWFDLYHALRVPRLP
jgi:hypothetical protein